MMDETTKTGARMNAFDWMLLVIALMSLLLAVGYLFFRRSHERSETPLTVVMRISGVKREDFTDLSSLIGSSVRSENGSSVLGTVSDASQTAHIRAVMRDGEAVLETDGERMDLEITVNMSGHRNAGQGIRVKDLRIAAGGRGNFRFGSYFAAGVEILSVEVKS
jgi:hypothetical protein